MVGHGWWVADVGGSQVQFRIGLHVQFTTSVVLACWIVAALAHRYGSQPALAAECVQP